MSLISVYDPSRPITILFQGTLFPDPIYVGYFAVLLRIFFGRLPGQSFGRSRLDDPAENHHTQFLYIDLFIIIPIAVTSKEIWRSVRLGDSETFFFVVGRTLPFPRIYPKPPTASLVSKKVLASITGQIVITGVVQVWAYLWVRRQEWYVNFGSALVYRFNSY